MKSYRLLLLFILPALVLQSCRKDEPVETPVISNSVSLVITNKVNGQVLDMAGGVYTNAFGNSFTVSKFKYYISNISFKKTDGTQYKVPVEKDKSTNYFLVNEAVPASKKLIMAAIPEGDYNAVTFLIGIDSLRNVSGAQDGALDPANDMYWDWNSGYIFLKMEGTSPDATNNQLTFHIGGFQPPKSTLRLVTLPLTGENITVRKNIAPEIHLFANLEKLFEGPTVIDFSVQSAALNGPDAVRIADNYQYMFQIDHVHNIVK
jgi:hypothetical protein